MLPPLLKTSHSIWCTPTPAAPGLAVSARASLWLSPGAGIAVASTGGLYATPLSVKTLLQWFSGGHQQRHGALKPVEFRTMKYDLHSHSTASDGTLTPTALVCEAMAAGVTCLALTDHDTVAGLSEARQAATGRDITIISGIELSSTWRGHTIHIVGLRLDVTAAELRRGIRRHLDFRDWRGRQIGRRLEKKAGIANAYQGALSFVHGGLVSRTHFARYLIEAGYAKNFGQAFKQYLLPGKPGHVRGDWASLREVVGWIRAANGIAVLAHPARYSLTAALLRSLLGEFIESGGEAMEVVTGSHTADDVKTMTGHALRLKLLASAGSDHHGPPRAYPELADLPAACTAIWDADIWRQRTARGLRG